MCAFVRVLFGFGSIHHELVSSIIGPTAIDRYMVVEQTLGQSVPPYDIQLAYTVSQEFHTICSTTSATNCSILPMVQAILHKPKQTKRKKEMACGMEEEEDTSSLTMKASLEFCQNVFNSICWEGEKAYC